MIKEQFASIVKRVVDEHNNSSENIVLSYDEIRDISKVGKQYENVGYRAGYLTACNDILLAILCPGNQNSAKDDCTEIEICSAMMSLMQRVADRYPLVEALEVLDKDDLLFELQRIGFRKGYTDAMDKITEIIKENQK